MPATQDTGLVEYRHGWKRVVRLDSHNFQYDDDEDDVDDDYEGYADGEVRTTLSGDKRFINGL